MPLLVHDALRRAGYHCYGVGFTGATLWQRRAGDGISLTVSEWGEHRYEMDAYVDLDGTPMNLKIYGFSAEKFAIRLEEIERRALAAMRAALTG